MLSRILVLFLLPLAAPTIDAFSVRRVGQSQSTAHFTPSTTAAKSPRQTRRVTTRTHQTCLSISLSLPSPPFIRAIVTCLATTCVALLARRPRFAADPSANADLPVGACPLSLRADNYRLSSPSFGPGLFFYQRSKRLRHPGIFKFRSGKIPAVVVSGYSRCKELLQKEFSEIQSNKVPFTAVVVGDKSLRTTTDRSHHALLRRLVGASLTTSAALAAAVPTLQQTAADVISKGLKQKELRLHELCVDFTLDVASNLIIGLQLDGQEILSFRRKVADWIDGVFQQDRSVALKCREYLVEKIRARMADTKQCGVDDGSTLAGMIFARDADNAQRLTEDEIVDNILLLILAGSETSSGTLTVVFLLLGLHPNAWQRIVTEQQALVYQYGPSLSRELLEDNCSYLEAVLLEALRLRPIAGGSMRGTTKTIIVDGKQIPKGWAVLYDRYLTHLLDPQTFQEDESHMDVRDGFVPERWLDSATRPTDFIPFGAGPRYCLGKDLAMLEMMVFVAELARRVSTFTLVEPDPESNILWKERCVVPVPRQGVVVVTS